MPSYPVSSAMPDTISGAPSGQAPVAVMFAVTSAWTICLAVTLHSLTRHSNPERSYELWVVHDGLEEEHMQSLHNTVSGYHNVALQFMTIPGKLEQMLHDRDVQRFSALAYARLLAPSLFPRHARIVYLDADTILYADVAELYDAELHGAPLGAIRDTAVLRSLVADYPRRQLPHVGQAVQRQAVLEENGFKPYLKAPPFVFPAMRIPCGNDRPRKGKPAPPGTGPSAAA